MVQKSPAEVLFSTYHRRILALLLLHPDQSFYVWEIARLTEVPAGSLHRELKRLAESGLLLREPVGNQVRYRANRDCPIFTELAGIFRKTVGLADVLREALAPLASEIDLAFIFGSVAQGKEGITTALAHRGDLGLSRMENGRLDTRSAPRFATELLSGLGMPAQDESVSPLRQKSLSR